MIVSAYGGPVPAQETTTLVERPGPVSQPAPPVTWLVAGVLPVLWHPSPAGAIAWAVAVLVGGLVARAHVLRWVALGWIAWVLVPAAPLLAVAASGAVARDARGCGIAAVLGAGLCLLGLPEVVTTAGTLLVLAGAVASTWSRA